MKNLNSIIAYFSKWMYEWNRLALDKYVVNFYVLQEYILQNVDTIRKQGETPNYIKLQQSACMM